MRAIENNALLEAERLAEATKNALKRKIEQAASSDFQTKTLPAKLKIDPNDPEDVVSQDSSSPPLPFSPMRLGYEVSHVFTENCKA